jgi:NAD(P)-dependent dehydrogenase (short-subunit alcohol dehydrogenase family)
MQATSLLRADLLAGGSVVVVGAEAEDGVGPLVAEACAGLGATVVACVPAPGGDAESTERLMDEAVSRARESAPDEPHGLAIDAGWLFAEPYAAGEPLYSCMLGCWTAVRAFAAGAGIDSRGGGRIVLVAPPADAGAHARGAAAGLENLARTLSIEWARYSITAVAIVPGAASTAAEVAAIVAYLLSPAGAYFSGCLLDLRGV